jgi:hypothetical protein
MKKISQLTWTPAWVSLIGCIHGCLKYLGIDPGFSWLYGGTGHAFLINMSKDGSCPSGPTAWKTNRFYQLGGNLGYSINGLFADNRQTGWQEKQAEAWDLARKALDKDLPVVGWELAIPEFYLVNGYDEVGYYYDGPGANLGASPKPWNDLGNTGIGMLEIFSVEPAEKAGDRQTIREALAFALAFNEGSPEWVLPDYRSGLEAYQVWIDAVSTGRAALMGHAYNAAVWEECRRNALTFLQEAKKRLKDPNLDAPFSRAIQAYQDVARNLKDLSELYPFFENNREEPLGDNPRSQKAAGHLTSAMKAEENGLRSLKDLLQALQ